MSSNDSQSKLLLLTHGTESLKGHFTHRANVECSKKCLLEGDEIRFFYSSYKKEKGGSSNAFLNKTYSYTKKMSSEIYDKEHSVCFKNCVYKSLKSSFITRDIILSKKLEYLDINPKSNEFFYTIELFKD